MLVEICVFAALAITMGVIYLILKKILPRFASFTYQSINQKIAEKYKQTNPKFIDYICCLKSKVVEQIFMSSFMLIFMTLLMFFLVIYLSIGYNIYYTYPNIQFTTEYFNHLTGNLRYALILYSVPLVIFLCLLISPLWKSYKYIGDKIKFYYHERDTNEYLISMTSSSNISIEQIVDAIEKNECGLVEEKNFEQIRTYCLTNPNSGFSNYISSQITKRDLVLDELLDSYQLKNNGFIDKFAYLQIKNHFISNPQISATDLNLLFEAIADGYVEMTAEKFINKKNQFMCSNADVAEKRSDMKMILSVMQDKGIISKEESKIKLNEYNK